MDPFRVSRLRPKEKRKKDATRQFKINRALGSKRTPQDVDPFFKDAMKNFLKSKSIVLKLLEFSFSQLFPLPTGASMAGQQMELLLDCE